jgi:hypothetical protein
VPSRLQQIAAAAAEFNSDAHLIGEQLELVVRVHLPSGVDDSFYMVASEERGQVVVGENRAKSNRLPVFCPERHINDNSTLCLFWARSDDAVDIVDETTAVEWFAALVGNLERQCFAERRHRWIGPSWRHGDAAQHQAAAETAAAQFGPAWLQDLVAQRIWIDPSETRCHVAGAPVRLMRSGRRLFSKRIGEARVANLRMACPCESERLPTTLRRCSDHTTVAARLIDALVAATRAEDEFVKNAKAHHACCGTIASCPLMTSTAVAA